MSDSENETLANWRRAERERERADEASISRTPPPSRPSAWGINEFDLQYVFERSTRNMHRYMPEENENEFDPLGKVYVNKLAVSNPAPRRIRITLNVTPPEA